ITQQQIYTISDDMFWTRGSHALKFGTLINHFNDFGKAETNKRGAYTFNSLQQFLLGNPLNYTVLTPGADTATNIRWFTLGFYFQDDWRVTPRLTFNLGLRYEFYTTVKETTDHGAALRDVIHDAKPTLDSAMFLNPSHRNFGPRVGFAWDMFGNASTSLRGG